MLLSVAGSELIRSNYLQVGGLLVSNTWVYGDMMDLVIQRRNAEGGMQNLGLGSQETVLVTVYCRPQKTYLLLASTNFLDWIPVATNTPTGSRFDYLDTLGSADGSSASSGNLPGELFRIPFGGAPNGAGEAPAVPQRFFRAVMLEHLYDSLRLSINSTNRRATLMLSNAQPAHTVVFQASGDLRRWTSLATNTPVAITNWPFLDTNAPAYPHRFYRAVGQGK